MCVIPISYTKKSNENVKLATSSNHLPATVQRTQSELTRYLDVVEFHVLGHAVVKLDNPEERCDDIDSTVSLTPQLVDALQRIVNIDLQAAGNNGVDHDWVRLVADLKDVLVINVSKS